MHQRKLSTYNKYAIKAVAVIVLCVFASIIGVAFAMFTKGISLILLLSLYFIKKSQKDLKLLNYGQKGEKTTQKILSKLPWSHYVIADATIQKPGGSNQLDHVVVGTKGIYIVETKNHVGKIQGSDETGKMIQSKWYGNKCYTNAYLNPSKQVQTHIRALTKLLESHGYSKIKIFGIVLFANPETDVELTSKQVKIFSVKKNGEAELLKYIKSYKTGCKINPKERKKIAKLIKKGH